MDKEQSIQFIQDLAKSGVLSAQEVSEAYRLGQDSPKDDEKVIGVSDVLGLAGALIVFLGVAFFVGQGWSTLSIFSRLFSTLGVAVISYLAGVILSRNPEAIKNIKLGYALHLVSALTLPVGIVILLEILNPGAFGQGWWQVLISIVLTLHYAVSYRYVRQSAFALFFTAVYAGLLFYSLCAAIYGPNSRYSWDDLVPNYIFAILGLSYALIGHRMRQLHSRMAGFFSFVGCGIVLISLLIASVVGFGRYNGPTWNFWTVVYALFPVLVLAYSVKTKNAWLLYLGTAFLMFYVIFLSSAFFAGTLGWPLALMICGLGLIGLGYVSVNLNRSYFLKFRVK